ncbi:Por secretion system C-terminal sorting domain-containing protein [Cyclonatronum proteinivorum]|uniref:Por secretion system C-terminal sorting domain-containing protein n=1 Tax=Cyclonatronum proteinivorum TaxID=1457365 RepID=A0A345ULI2_9BACT|nr:S8 family serine peptidase [Cyclonatronum proteinivorum]AXJ01334.1 Por secretion system C-terminal sorting domain-containing protein [Cyclonatronum proteinivorum]
MKTLSTTFTRLLCLSFVMLLFFPASNQMNLIGQSAGYSSEQYASVETAYITGIGEIEYFRNELVVEFTSGLLAAEAELLHQQLGVTQITELELINAQLWRFENGTVQQALDMLNGRSDVVYAEPNFVYRIPDFVIEDENPLESLQSTVPNDPFFTSLWGLNNTGQNGGTPGADISALEAWAVTKGSPEVIVAVFDSGIRSTHPDLVDNLWFDENGNPGASFLGDTPEDLNGHGTHVAGTIGAVGNNNEGITGVNWDVTLMNIKICGLNGSPTCNGAAIVQGLQYAIENGAQISNHSWGGPGFSQAAFNAIEAAGQAGHFVIAAAGNNGSNNDNQNFYPAGYDLPNVMAVASSDRNDLRSSFSNFGANTVHVAAPGSAILSTYINQEGYAILSGTSMASPHAAGLAALLKAENPDASPSELRTLIMDGVDPVPAFQNITIAGGRINAFNSLGLLGDLPVAVLNPQSFQEFLEPGESTTVQLTIANEGEADLTYVFPDFVMGRILDGTDTRFEATRQQAITHVQSAFENSDEARQATAERLSGTMTGETRSDTEIFRRTDGNPEVNQGVFPIEFDGLTLSGGEFITVSGDLNGELTAVAADFVIEAEQGGTWASDFGVLFTTVELETGAVIDPSTVLLQVGGLTNYGPSGSRIAWGVGSSGSPGTPVNTTINIPTPLDMSGVFVSIGHAWAPGGASTWSGLIELVGAEEGESFITDVSPTSGTVSPNGSQSISVTLDASELTDGVYTRSLRVQTNDPFNQQFSVPVELTVAGEPGELVFEPGNISLELMQGENGAFNFAIGNQGGGALDFSITGGLTGLNRTLTPVRNTTAVVPVGQTYPNQDTSSQHVFQTTADEGSFPSVNTSFDESDTYPARSVLNNEVILTHSLSQEIANATGVRCGGSGTTADNSFLRTYTLTDFDVNDDFSVTAVQFGVESVVGPALPVEVRVYLLEGDFTFSNMTLIGTGSANINSNQDLSVVTIPVEAEVPAGSTIVVEAFISDSDTSDLFPGANSLGETAPSYIASHACGIPEPITYASIGFSDVHLVLNVVGESGEALFVFEPDSGTLAAGEFGEVAVTANTSGLSAGNYTAEIAIATNSPLTPLGIIPVDIEIDGDGVELPAISVEPGSLNFAVQTGDSSSQTMTVTNTGTGTLEVDLSATFGSARAFDERGNLIAAAQDANKGRNTANETHNGLTAESTLADVLMSEVLSVAPNILSLSAGQSATVTVSLDASALSPGSYAGSVSLSSNAVNNPNLNIPVSVAVSPVGEQVVLWQQNRAETGGIVTGTFEGLGTATYSADDFEISQTAALTSISTLGFQNDQTFLDGILLGYQVYIFADADGSPAGEPYDTGSWVHAIEVDADDPRLSVSQEGNLYTLTLDVSSFGWVLNPGRYWLSVAPVQNLPSLDGAARWNWAQGEQNFGEPVLIDPDDNFGIGLFDWTPLSTIGLDWNPAGLTFTILGIPGSDTDNPSIAVQPGNLNFAVQTGDSSSQTMTVTNTGSGTLEVELSSAFGSARAFDKTGNLIAASGPLSQDTNTISGARDHQLTAAYSGAVGLMSDILSVAPSALSLSAGQSATVTVSLDASSLAPGSYGGSILLSSNAANNPELSVAVSVSVSPEGEAVVLWDQSGDTITNGALSIYDLDEPEVWAVEAADDFLVPDGQVWAVTAVEALGFYADLINQPLFANVFFYTDASGRPADEPSFGFFEAEVTSSADGIIFIELPEAAVLDAGTWWVSVAPHMDYFADGRWFWLGNSSSNGGEFHWRNPGGGYGDNTSWTPQSVAFPDFTVQDLAFRVFGTSDSDDDPAPGDPDFVTPVSVSDTADNSVILTFGTAADATPGFDPQYDLFAPPPGPAGTFDARISFDDDDYFTFFQPTTTEQTVWPVLVRPSAGNAPVTLSWDPSTLAEEGIFHLSGNGISVDMRQENSVVVPGTGFQSLTVTHSLSAETEVTYLAGWNLVGMAYDMPHDAYGEIFTGSIANTLFGFDGSYTQRETLNMGEGYWLRFEDASTVPFTGMPQPMAEIELQESWNLISGHAGCEGPCGIDDPNGIIIAGTLFGFDGSYFQAETLDAGMGYWVRTSESGSVGIGAPSASSVPLALNPEGLDAYATLQFSTPEGIHRELRLGADAAQRQHPMQFSLPPVPPSGAFDVRFSDDFWLVDEASAWIALQSADQPVELSFTAGLHLPDTGAELILMRGSEVADTQWLETGASLQLMPDITDIQVALSLPTSIPDETPGRFDLAQNYPNPFNPTTLIEYALPEASEVRLEVFNLTGQRVAVLVNGTQNAGHHTVSFDATRLSSGVYIYRLQAGSFVQTRKMMLVK